MNRKELEEQIAEKSGITKAAAERVLKALIERLVSQFRLQLQKFLLLLRVKH